MGDQQGLVAVERLQRQRPAAAAACSKQRETHQRHRKAGPARVADFQLSELLCPSVTNLHRLIQKGITSGHHDHLSQVCAWSHSTGPPKCVSKVFVGTAHCWCSSHFLNLFLTGIVSINFLSLLLRSTTPASPAPKRNIVALPVFVFFTAIKFCHVPPLHYQENC